MDRFNLKFSYLAAISKEGWQSSFILWCVKFSVLQRVPQAFSRGRDSIVQSQSGKEGQLL